MHIWKIHPSQAAKLYLDRLEHRLWSVLWGQPLYLIPIWRHSIGDGNKLVSSKFTIRTQVQVSLALIHITIAEFTFFYSFLYWGNHCVPDLIENASKPNWATASIVVLRNRVRERFWSLPGRSWRTIWKFSVIEMENYWEINRSWDGELLGSFIHSIYTKTFIASIPTDFYENVINEPTFWLFRVTGVYESNFILSVTCEMCNTMNNVRIKKFTLHGLDPSNLRLLCVFSVWSLTVCRVWRSSYPW